MTKPRLFVGSSVESLTIAYAIQENLESDFDVTVWSQGVFEPSQYTLESLVSLLERIDFAAFVFSPDDAANIRDATYQVVRDNVLFEMGLAVGALGRNRTYIFLPKNVPNLHMPSDLLGLTPVTYDGARREDFRAVLGPACNQVRQAALRHGKGRSSLQYPANISCSYTNTDWPRLLENAGRVTLSVIYVSDDWYIRFAPSFTRYLEGGGRLELFLPPLDGFESLYGSTTRLSTELGKRMLQTVRRFCDMNRAGRGDLRIVMMPQGFNYMFARVESRGGQRVFTMSPYPNNYGRGGSPVFHLDENATSDEMRTFIEREVNYAHQLADAHPAFEKQQYSVWRPERNRVFISTNLSCPAGCKFCYVPSLVRSHSALKNTTEVLQLCASVVSDKRFQSGRTGTKVLLGAFSDPLHPSNIAATGYVLRFLSAFDNQIHIATRYPPPEDLSCFGEPSGRVVFNVSFAARGHSIEVDNIDERFRGAARLKAAGFPVSLFLRPVIAGVTLAQLDDIIAVAKAAAIDTVTIGGLYVDERIRRRMSDSCDLNALPTVPKDFVLDDRHVLQKLGIPDLDLIQERFVSVGFNTFFSSDQRVEYYERLA